MLHRQGSKWRKARVPVTRYAGSVTSQSGLVGYKQTPAILSSKLVGAIAEKFSLQNANNAVVVKFYMCRIMTWNIKRKKKCATAKSWAHNYFLSLFLSPNPLLSSGMSEFPHGESKQWKVLTVNGDTAFYGDTEQFFLLCLEKNQTVPGRTAACLKALAVPTQCSCALDPKGRLCFLSGLADWDAVEVWAELGTWAQGQDWWVKWREGEWNISPSSASVFPALLPSHPAEKWEEHQREIQAEVTEEERRWGRKQTKGKIRSKVRALKTVKRHREENKK